MSVCCMGVTGDCDYVGGAVGDAVDWETASG